MTASDWQPGLVIHGFSVRNVTPLPELNATLIELDHPATGARMVHLATADDNNLFGVAFFTPPEDSTGIAHILEHTVLCGSQKFPVRDPFFSMLKRSLNTFMNALTSSDWTLYPFSSQNEKDFYNLMSIYLDAAFFPLLRERDFRQEGHRLEVSDPNDPTSPLVFKGVVYNEMKGAMADPSSLLGRRMNRALYPTTTYGHNSGGEPSVIPDLTWEELRDFHRRFYHPANAYFFTYGNLPLEKHLATISGQVLSGFDLQPAPDPVADERRYRTPQRKVEAFPVDAGTPLERRSMVQVGWLTCPVADSRERTAMNLLSVLLLGNPAAPLYKALLDSGLGQNLAPGCGYHDEYRETSFAAGLQGTDPESAEAIEEIILKTLSEAAETGFSPERIETAIHQMEFAHREVSGDHYPYALQLLMRLLGPWIHSGDPVSPLLLEQDLDAIRRETQRGPFFQELIRRQLLTNPHRVTLILKPDPTAKEEEEEATAARLEKIGETLGQAERIRLIDQAAELKAAQEAREDLSSLPTLELDDIPARETAVPWQKEVISGVPGLWFDQPTNGIVYFSAHFDVAGLADELRPYLPLFSALLPQIGAAGKDWQEMAEALAAATGGVRAGAAVLETIERVDGFAPLFEVKGKALLRNAGKMFGLLTELCTAPDFTDRKRLHTVIGQVKISLENSIPSSGHSYAARAAAAGLSAGGRQREEWNGLSLIRFVRQIAALPAEELEPIAGRMAAIAAELMTRGRLRCALTAEAKAHTELRRCLTDFLQALPAGAPSGETTVSSFQVTPGRTGWAASVPVSYVAKVFRTVPWTHADAPALTVLAKVLRAGFLHREIREKGGAYGGLAGFDPESGLFSLLSYRDPHLVRTLGVYRDAAVWAAEGSFDDEAIKEAILAVFSDLDRPLSPGSRGNREFSQLRQGLTPELRQRFRQRLLAVDHRQLTEVAKRYLNSAAIEQAVSVVAGEEALKLANEELGKEGLTVERV